MAPYKKLLSIFILTGFSLLAQASDAFTIKAITVQGLQGISKATLLSYLPLQVGETVTENKSAAAIQALYATGFFQDVRIHSQGNTLLVVVVERPTIGQIKVVGSKDLSQDKLTSVLKELSLLEGRSFNPAAVAKLKNSLLAEYNRRGRTNTQILVKTTPKTHNRVDVLLTIKEGQAVKISDIKIVGNHALKTRELTKQLILTTTRPWSFITHDNEFTQEKLEASIDALRNYYLDRGFIHIKIEGAEPIPNADGRKMNLLIHLSEGVQYHIKEYTVSGEKLLADAEINRLIAIQLGSVFSKQKISDAVQAIGHAVGNQGYAFASVNVLPTIDEVNKLVTLNFHIEPGKRVYVKRINFIGNTKTEDRVLRREMRQPEGAMAVVDDIEESKRRLNLLGFLEGVDVITKPVAGADDQIDLDFHMTEAPSAQATASIGYGTRKVELGAKINQSNFLGTGKTLNLGFDTSSYAKNYNISYNNPYYTPSGIQRGFNLYLEDVTPANLDLASYTTSSYGGSVNYSIPLFTPNDSVQLGLGYQALVLNIGSSPSVQLTDFVIDHGRHFNQAVLTAGWSRNSLDRALFPTQGLQQNFDSQLSLPAGQAGLQYYKLNYNTAWYYPLTLSKRFILVMHGGTGYGNGLGDTNELPFFQNFYAGGMGYAGAVRGFETYQLGPKDSKGNPLGGNLFVAGSAAVIFPHPLHVDNLRTSAFVDAGNTYNTRHISQLSYHAGPIRYTTGLMAEWRLGMLGVLDFSVAKTLNAHPGDSKEVFKFTVGTSI